MTNENCALDVITFELINLKKIQNNDLYYMYYMMGYNLVLYGRATLKLFYLGNRQLFIYTFYSIETMLNIQLYT